MVGRIRSWQAGREPPLSRGGRSPPMHGLPLVPSPARRACRRGAYLVRGKMVDWLITPGTRGIPRKAQHMNML
jgi:hypothetical protein